MNKRIFVEKKGLFDVESPKIFDEVKTIISQIKSVKVYNIYDIFGVKNEEFEKVVNSTFADPVTDILHAENPAKNMFFATEFLPGQYDQRADSAEQCIALLTQNDNVKVRSVESFCFKNKLEEKISVTLAGKIEDEDVKKELVIAHFFFRMCCTKYAAINH